MNNPYKSPKAALREPGPSPASNGFIALGLLLCAAPALTCQVLAGRVEALLLAFGAALPLPTELVLGYHALLWLLPIAVGGWVARSRPAMRARRAFACGAVCAVLVMPLCVAALYLPVFRIGGVVG